MKFDKKRARAMGRRGAAVRRTLRADPAELGQLSILDVMQNPRWFGRMFAGASWHAWRAFLTALFGLPLTATEFAIYRRHTGRERPPGSPARESWLIVGRRGGKSRVAALVAVYLACFRDYSGILAPGERGIVTVLAADRKQARTVFRYCAGLLQSVPALARLVEQELKEEIRLKNGVSIEIHVSSYRGVRATRCLGPFATSGDRSTPRARGKRGPRTAQDDATVLGVIRTVLEESPFHTEGHRKVRVRLRRHGIYVGKNRVLRLMREGRLLAPTRRNHVHGDRAHAGTIITPRPDELWGTDATKFYTQREG